MATATLPSPTFQKHSRQILVAGFAGSFFSVGFSIYLFGAFQNAMIETFGTSVATFSLASSIFTAVSGTLSPFVGRSIVTRGRPGLSIRAVMLAGSVSIGVGLLTISRMETIGLAALAWGLLVAPGTILLGPLVTQAMATNWFDATRGQAPGIVAAGTTVAGGVIPTLAAILIESMGWRDAMATLGLLMLAIPLPLVALFARSTPEEVGEQPDGAPVVAGETPAAGEVPLSTSQLLRNRYLWIVGVMFGLQFSAGTISVMFTIPYAQQLELSLVASAAVLSFRSWFAALGKILLGRLSDRVGVRRVFFGVLAVEIIFTLLLIQAREPVFFAIVGIGLGFVGGAALPLKGALVGELFGRASFASAFGLLQTVGVPFQLLLIPLGGYIRDVTGSYSAVFAATIPLFILAAFLLLFVKPEPAG
jgi:MFS family permease